MAGTLSNSIRVVSRFCWLALGFTVLGCSDVSTQIVIPASPTEVWKVLVDTKGCKEWNPTWPKRGSLQRGVHQVRLCSAGGAVEMRFIVGKSVRPSVIERSAGTSGLLQ